MAAVCHNPTLTAEQAHPISDSDRHLRVSLDLNWGDQDLRADWQGEHDFCSFQCLADWATEMAARHDERTLVEGATPEGDGA